MRYLLAALSLTCLAAAPALAHRRHFIETFEAYLPAAGEWEIEAHTDAGLHPRVGYTDFHNEIWGLVGLAFPPNGRSQPLQLRTLLEAEL